MTKTEAQSLTKVNLTYFKPTGKYYSSGECYVEGEHMFEVFASVRKLCNARTLPGLIDGAHGYHVLIKAPEHPLGYPRIIPADTY